MYRNNIIQEQRLNVYYIILLLLPPLFSCIISLYILFKVRKLKTLLFFGFFYTLCLTYIYPTYDTMLRYWRIHSIHFISIMDDDPLSYLASIFSEYLDAYYFFFIYWIATIILFYKAISFNRNNIPLYVIIISIFGLTWNNFMNLTYFTFATVFSLYFMEKYKEKYVLYIPFIFIAYLLHPGVLMVFLPSILLHYLLKNEKYKLAILYVVVCFVFLRMLFGSMLAINSNNLFVSNMVDSFNSYTSEDSVWGKNIINLGLKGSIFDLIQYILFVIILYYVIKNIRKINTYISTSFFIIALVAIVNVYGFYTFSERMRIIAIISSLIIVSLLYMNKLLHNIIIRRALIILIILQFFISNILFIHPNRDLFIREYTSYDISIRVAYIPSFLLVTNIHTFSFSDSYLYNNSINRN